MADSVLQKILKTKREEVAAAKAACGMDEIKSRAVAAAPPRDFTAHLFEATRGGNNYALIAEIKRKSPSAGMIRENFDIASLARAYADGGAQCLSVLTDKNYFGGDLNYIAAARNATALPVLRKDFMIDPYQIYESRAAGADAILLIMAALDDARAIEMETIAHALGMAVLIEVHNEDELARVVQAEMQSPLIGINNRDLAAMKTDLATAERLIPQLPRKSIAVAESGLKTPADLARMAAAGARVFLIGESLMREDDVAGAVRVLLANPAPATSPIAPLAEGVLS